MKEIRSRLTRRPEGALPAFLFLLLVILFNSVKAGQVERTLFLAPEGIEIETGIKPIAVGSDSLFCAGHLLQRDLDYSLNVLTGRISFTSRPACDTLLFVAFQLPPWMIASVGNPVPQGKRILLLEPELIRAPEATATGNQRINLSGNKTFSLTVGRTGEGYFSQGLNLDFDALLATDLHLRGSISDRMGAGGTLPGGGGTTTLSELDKYFFEIEGTHLKARGGDIAATTNAFLPFKRIKGVGTAYSDNHLTVSADAGRPAGKFVSQTLSGVDGRQGPYAVQGANGLPTGIVPGSEKVYIDGQLLEGGADKYYSVDYPAGRILFSPRILITARSRLEVDFEAAENNYEQLIYTGATQVRLAGDKIRFSIGARQESDDKDRLQFTSLSAGDVNILKLAGDSASKAYKSGVVATTQGSYVLTSDSVGNPYYLYVAGDMGQYDVSFSHVGEGKGDYRYLGDNVYQYIGKSKGNYLPIVYLPLPTMNNYLYAALSLFPYSGGEWQLEYQGNDQDKNLFSSLDDKDNFRSQLEGKMIHKAARFSSAISWHYRQSNFSSAKRINPPDYELLWALPTGNLSGDEFRLKLNQSYDYHDNHFRLEGGHVSYKDNLKSHRVAVDLRMFDNWVLSPRVNYQTGNSRRSNHSGQNGLFERFNTVMAVKPVKPLRLEIGLDRELTQNKYSTEPRVAKYTQYRSAAFFRNTTLGYFRRIDFSSGFYGTKGPQLDRIEMNSEEQLGRVRASFSGIWANQKKLDSDANDQTERLFQTSIRFSPSSGWMSLQADYRQNQQIAYSSGYHYLQVNAGEGDYRYEGGLYLYDPDGDYIRIGEETGGETQVATGEKSHNLTLYPGRLAIWGKHQALFSQVAVRLRTEVTEEIPGKDRRHLSWLLPWVSGSGLNYLLRDRREMYAVSLFPAFNYYILDFSYSNAFEEQEGGAQLYRCRKEYQLIARDQLSSVTRGVLEWHHWRDSERGTEAVPLALIGNGYSASLVVNQGQFQLIPKFGYIQLHDDFSDGEGFGFSIGNEAVYRRANRGEIRLISEGRSLTEKRPFTQTEYLVTDGQRFGRSAVITAIANYNLGKSLRLTVNFTDRIFEHRPAEFVGKGDLIAQF